MQSCPLCGSAVAENPRYPAYVCERCVDKASSATGRRVRYYNIDMSGGCEGQYEDDGSPYPSSRCWIDNTECRAEEARFGGIVIQPL